MQTIVSRVTVDAVVKWRQIDEFYTQVLRNIRAVGVKVGKIVPTESITPVEKYDTSSNQNQRMVLPLQYMQKCRAVKQDQVVHLRRSFRHGGVLLRSREVHTV